MTLYDKDALVTGASRGIGKAIAERPGKDGAAYRDAEGALHAVSAICTHRGCVVEWNAVDKSWDCPCHGSRYDYDGRVLQGPAQRELDVKPIEAAIQSR